MGYVTKNGFNECTVPKLTSIPSPLIFIYNCSNCRCCNQPFWWVICNIYFALVFFKNHIFADQIFIFLQKQSLFHFDCGLSSAHNSVLKPNVVYFLPDLMRQTLSWSVIYEAICLPTLCTVEKTLTMLYSQFGRHKLHETDICHMFSKIFIQRFV